MLSISKHEELVANLGIIWSSYLWTFSLNFSIEELCKDKPNFMAWWFLSWLLPIKKDFQLSISKCNYAALTIQSNERHFLN